MTLHDELMKKIKDLSGSIWADRAKGPKLTEWLNNFDSSTDEPLHALYLLSHFMFFGGRQMRELMRVLFRDLYRYPIVASIRSANNDTTDVNFINFEFQKALAATMFLGVGNPSESGCHLLYYFRQENGLPKTRFIHTHEIFQRRLSRSWRIWNWLFFSRTNQFAVTQALRNPNIRRYVFIDDFCGSGKQGVSYSADIVDDIKAADPTVNVSYFMLFATTKGMSVLKSQTSFDEVQCVFELDDSFRCFSPSSRYFTTPIPGIDKAVAETICRKYGDRLVPNHPLGYDNSQLLLGFDHNTPDNTLPIFWFDEPLRVPWIPIFKRYAKYYV